MPSAASASSPTCGGRTPLSGSARWRRFCARTRRASTPLMDFATRDRYRRTVETIARSSGVAELDVASRAVALAREAHGRPGGHVGYYLLLYREARLEAATACRLGAREWSRRWVRHHCRCRCTWGASPRSHWGFSWCSLPPWGHRRFACPDAPARRAGAAAHERVGGAGHELLRHAVCRRTSFRGCPSRLGSPTSAAPSSSFP